VVDLSRHHRGAGAATAVVLLLGATASVLTILVVACRIGQSGVRWIVVGARCRRRSRLPIQTTASRGASREPRLRPCRERDAQKEQEQEWQEQENKSPQVPSFSAVASCLYVDPSAPETTRIPHPDWRCPLFDQFPCLKVHVPCL
jgi:hypothetical protein